MTRTAGTFLGGAKSRLLPPSIPFRFFGAAIAYHLLAWLALLAGADTFPYFGGGPGWPLAALHLTTLGVIVMSTIGASLQLLPVATRQAVGSSRWPILIWWLYTPGVAAVALGMGLGEPLALGLGAALVVLALVGYAALLAINLRGARGMPVVIACGWTALACLLVLLLTALSLALNWLGFPFINRQTALALHLAFAAYGFMGLIIVGMSTILIPMFALSEMPAQPPALTACALIAAALGTAGIAAFDVAAQPLHLIAIGLGLIGVTIHLRAMQTALRTGMRRELGQSFVLVRVGWFMLIASLALALAIVLDAPFDGLRPLFGLTLIGGWLLSFLFGILRRVLPFLASMHVSGRGRRTPTPSSLSDERALVIHYSCHLGALAGLAVAILTSSPTVATISAVLGACGATAFGVFFLKMLQRMRKHSPGAGPMQTAAPQPQGPGT